MKAFIWTSVVIAFLVAAVYLIELALNKYPKTTVKTPAVAVVSAVINLGFVAWGLFLLYGVQP